MKARTIMKNMDQFQQYIHISRYARWRDDVGRRETWEETVDRYCTFFDERFKGAYTDYIWNVIKPAIFNLEVMPSMRALMTAGPALDRENLAGFNCSYLAVNNKRSFSETLYILMCFQADTQIMTVKGRKRIADVTLEDKVLSFDEKTQEFIFLPISNLHKNDVSNKKKVELTFDDGSTVTCTEDHLFLTKNRGWVQAKDLEDTDDIQD